jgi:hypothetical protein
VVSALRYDLWQYPKFLVESAGILRLLVFENRAVPVAMRPFLIFLGKLAVGLGRALVGGMLGGCTLFLGPPMKIVL